MILIVTSLLESLEGFNRMVHRNYGILNSIDPFELEYLLLMIL